MSVRRPAVLLATCALFTSLVATPADATVEGIFPPQSAKELKEGDYKTPCNDAWDADDDADCPVARLGILNAYDERPPSPSSTHAGGAAVHTLDPKGPAAAAGIDPNDYIVVVSKIDPDAPPPPKKGAPEDPGSQGTITWDVDQLIHVLGTFAKDETVRVWFWHEEHGAWRFKDIKLADA